MSARLLRGAAAALRPPVSHFAVPTAAGPTHHGSARPKLSRSYSTSPPPARAPRRRSLCPFRTLGVPKSSTYSDVKSAFLRLALKHHPDTATSRMPSLGDGEEEDTEGVVAADAAEARRKGDAAAAEFVRLRAAFEAIAEGEDGAAVLREDLNHGGGSRGTGGAGPGASRRSSMSEEEFGAWFQAETGHAVPYDHASLRHVDPAVMREVAEVTERMAPGGLDRGGMWQLAASLRGQARRGDLPPLRVGGGPGGTGGGPGAEGRLRRRKRK